jgi:hypothetical protein
MICFVRLDNRFSSSFRQIFRDRSPLTLRQVVRQPFRNDLSVSGQARIKFSFRVAASSDVEANAFKQRRGAVRGFSMKETDDLSSSKKRKRRGLKTDSTDAQQKPWLFKPGQSGNPAGRLTQQTVRGLPRRRLSAMAAARV